MGDFSLFRHTVIDYMYFIYFYCVCPKPTQGLPGLFCVQRFELIGGYFVDICVLLDHHCLNFFFTIWILFPSKRIRLSLVYQEVLTLSERMIHDRVLSFFFLSSVSNNKFTRLHLMSSTSCAC